MAARLARLVEPASIQRLAVSGLVLVVAIFAAVRLLDLGPWNDRLFDLWAYWSTRFGLDYALARPGESGAYIYSPAFAQLITPLTALPLPVFTALWTVFLGAVLYWLAGWRGFFIGILAPVTMSLAIGQLDVLMAAVIVIGFRWPAVWVLPFITKLTPGIGVLWFAARGEWRSFAVALGTTIAVVAVSFAIAPAAWAGWIDMLIRFQLPTSANGVFLPVPIWARLPLVALLIVWGARTDRRWTLPVAMTFSLPTVWLNTPTILIGALPLLAIGADTPAGRWLRSPAALPRLSIPRPAIPTLPGLERLPEQLRRLGRLGLPERLALSPVRALALPRPRVRGRLRWAGIVARRQLGELVAARSDGDSIPGS
jgi:glycosyl transferase family 87